MKRGGIEEVDWIKSLGLNFNDLAFGGLFLFDVDFPEI